MPEGKHVLKGDVRTREHRARRTEDKQQHEGNAMFLEVSPLFPLV